MLARCHGETKKNVSMCDAHLLPSSRPIGEHPDVASICMYRPMAFPDIGNDVNGGITLTFIDQAKLGRSGFVEFYCVC